MPNYSQHTTTLTVQLIGDRVNPDYQIAGKPTKAFDVTMNAHGSAFLHRTIDWAVNNQVDVIITHKQTV